MQFRIFVEVQNADGYWTEANTTNGFLDGYCPSFDGYLTEELFIGLNNIYDGYFSKQFKQPLPSNLSNTVRYKLDMLSCLNGNAAYSLGLDMIDQFNWSQNIYASFITTPTTYNDVAPNFLAYIVPSLNALGPSNQVRLIVLKKGS
jgi:hypothetical protein